MSIRTKMYPSPTLKSVNGSGEVVHTPLPRTHQNMTAEYGRARPGKTAQDRARKS
jgi:hypothetical protein